MELKTYPYPPISPISTLLARVTRLFTPKGFANDSTSDCNTSDNPSADRSPLVSFNVPIPGNYSDTAYDAFAESVTVIIAIARTKSATADGEVWSDTRVMCLRNIEFVKGVRVPAPENKPNPSDKPGPQKSDAVRMNMEVWGWGVILGVLIVMLE
ncbi:hypothetical protein K469DRAFT_683605 [Zopfia rhizophila CBS 207.26]|uniref:Uncharacterized protein n=1 Tax=Zopfia rhizophila CBS 207.26 TaxID=1314779 RepID=A0A6A6EB00_9PEZI|nr:hypothetical protein K469DRAFT_683605 [Zopfia rhizophila CBS 207.26]